jgi:hypothetical protein
MTKTNDDGSPAGGIHQRGEDFPEWHRGGREHDFAWAAHIHGVHWQLVPKGDDEWEMVEAGVSRGTRPSFETACGAAEYIADRKRKGGEYKGSVTPRGFGTYAEFVDRYGTPIRVQQSSLATEAAVWIFTEDNPAFTDPANPPSPHLTVDMARQMIEGLQAFVDDVESGRF